MQTELERQLAVLVSMPTITADTVANDQALDYVEQYLAKRGMHCKRDHHDGHGILTASTRADNRTKPALCLSAHIDVVTGDEAVFTLREASGKLYGRGVFDMKFAIAAYMELIDTLAAEGRLADYDIGIMITSDEEATKDNKSGVTYLLENGYRSRVAILPDSTAPGWDIEKVTKGWWRFDLIASGITAHSSRPWEGESASFKLIHALHELKERFANTDPVADTLNIGSIHGGDIYNQIPDQMAAKIEIRFVDEKAPGTYKALITDLCARHGLTCQTFSLVDPVYPIINDPLVSTYRDVVEQVTGKRPQDFVSLGGSDAPYFTAAGIPCILSCPLGGKHHSNKEWVDKQSLRQFAPILRAYIDAITHDTKAPAPVDTQTTVV